jgi:PKD repeat protein
MALDECGPNTIYIADVGCYDALLTVTNSFGCVDSVFMADYICINSNPVADFSASTYNASITDNTVIFTNESFNATSYLWEFGDGSSSSDVDVIHMFPTDSPGEYTVILYAYNDAGCIDSTSKIITLWDRLLFYVPTAFTPDGDQYNTVFKPVFGSGFDVADYRLLI